MPMTLFFKKHRLSSWNIDQHENIDLKDKVFEVIIQMLRSCYLLKKGSQLEQVTIQIFCHLSPIQAPQAHKVAIPPRQNLFKEFQDTIKETFFSDDPLRPFKDQPRSRKIRLGIEAIFPILSWGRSYNLKKFRGDLISGLTIASLCIPQDIGYAKLAHLAPQYGLYSSFVPPLIYAVMGSSRDIAIGPVAVVSLLLGFLIDFLSHAAIVGFMGGAAITIALQQLKGFLGIKTKQFTTNTDIVHVMHSVFNTAHHGWNWQTIVMGASFLGFLLVAKYIGKKNTKFFWVPAIAPLISVILSTFIVFITRADKQGVEIVRKIKRGINPSSVKDIYFTGEYLGKGFKIGIVAGMIALTEATAIGRTFASMKDYQLDGNREMMALGTMNVVGSMTSCYVATGKLKDNVYESNYLSSTASSFSRSAVNYMAGCQTAVSNIVMSVVVFLTLKFITPLFYYTPNAILSAIIISAVISLVDYEAAILIWKIDKFDFVACMGAFFGVAFVSVEKGLLIAVSISYAKILLQVTRPRTAILGKIPRTTVYRNIQQYPEASKIPAVTDIDTSGIQAFEELHRSLEKKGVELVLANPGPAVTDKLYASSFANTIGEDKIFLTVAQAVAYCSPKVVEDP
ncbi:Sulfate transporter 1.3 [Glycine soja]